MTGSRSPLELALRAPEVDAFVHGLAETRDAIVAAPDRAHVLVFSRARVDVVKAEFAASIRRGESSLHRLCALLAASFFDASHALESVVVGELPSTRERFTLAQPLRPEELYLQTDLDLGNRVLSRVVLAGERPQLVANVVEYQPHVANRWGIHKMISRIKAEEEVWNKVCDEIFRLDEIVRRDKILRVLSRYVKDVFGIKVVVGSDSRIAPLQAAIEELIFAPEHLSACGVESEPGAARLEIVEVKEYVRGGGKTSGWEAMKSVVRWRDRMFELQIQALGNYFLEREALTRESHAAFKAQREAVREQVVRADPLYGFYRDLLKWLFLREGGAPPSHPGVRVEVGE